ncbi:hypothetical protein BGZ94_001963 [Podila epigama]|nr:hypothetical protein BGZ94_001963 [Podila epigama]
MTITKAEHPVVDEFFKGENLDQLGGKTFTATKTTTTTKTTTSTSTTATSNDSKSGKKHPSSSGAALGPKMNPVYKAVRGLLWALYFNLGASLISVTQVLSLPLSIIAPGVYRRHINRTEGHFGAFLLKMNQLFAPSDIIVTGDESVRGLIQRPFKGLKESDNGGGHVMVDKDGKEKLQLKQTVLGEEVFLDMPERLILISNHQGMRFFDFIFLKRNDWAHDKRAIEENLDRVNPKDPLWLIVFPEGTVVSKDTRKRSSTFAQKAGLADHRHVLLPRTSGLFVCINKLRGSVDYVYDTTVGYSGIAYGEVPQELYPLPGLYLNQAQPKEISMHLRRFAIKDIPTTEPEFVEWVRARWHEKDDLMEEFYTTGKFPSQLIVEDEEEVVEETKTEVKEEDDSTRTMTRSITKGRLQGHSIRIPLKSRSMLDYVPPSALNLMALPVLAFAVRYALQQSA